MIDTTAALLPREGTMQDRIDLITEALQNNDPGDALRQLTYLTKLLKTNRERISSTALEIEPLMPNREWDSFIKASITHTLGKEAPQWAKENQKLNRPWFPMPFRSLRARAEKTTPAYLRDLNIFIDSKSLSRA